MTKRYKILMAEDEPALGKIIKESLESRGFEVRWVVDGVDVIPLFQEDRPDVLVLDVMMPKMDGFMIAHEIRKKNRQVPIIFLTAKSQTMDAVQGFKVGGNDYIRKPFGMEELIVRIRNLIGHGQPQNHPIQIGKYVFDFKKQTLKFMDEPFMELTHRESQILYFLSTATNEVVERSFVLKKLWGDDDFFAARSMDVFISNLRKKLKKDPEVRIVNIRGIGYKLIL
ncbi:response regulator transcription factor [Flagellimonas hadalis]|uniref:Response regulator transcription factor n=1 Tax=Flagellimonas hadalis TaxID=2597517 RepID=A0A5N5IKA8_9FLAO|nr:response regulator transcription factor [Allomuricauda hadalis]KAB5484484.1 response regulator transcription factor [Allomuricauda hadalis]